MKHFSKKSMLYSLLGLLGFSSCENESPGPDMYGPIVMYGPPVWSYTIPTRITNENDKPIKGIRSIMNITTDNEKVVVRDTVFTDNDGIAINQIPQATTHLLNEQAEITFRYEDIDGAENGSYESKEEKIAFKDIADKNTTVKLKEKKNEE